MKKKFIIPIYDAILWLIVTDDLPKARQEMNDTFGPPQGIAGSGGLCSANMRGSFALFFDSLTVSNVAHEVFHLTHRILEWASCNFDSSHHEQGALLHGYLMDLVTRELRGLKLDKKCTKCAK